MTDDLTAMRRSLDQSGRATLWIVLGVLIVATMVVLGFLIAGVVGTSQADQEKNHRNALRISDQGIQEASLQLNTDPLWRAGFAKTTYLDGWYAVTVSTSDSAGAKRMVLVSEGHCRSSTIRQIYTLRRVATAGGDSVWERESMKQE
jgi:hypothetical protein